MSKTWVKGLLILVLATVVLYAEEEKMFNGLYLDLGNLFRLSHAQSRSISPENFSGEKGKAGMSIDGPAMKAARDLGQGWKVSPYIIIKPKETFILADIKGPGAIQQIWMTPAGNWRFSILRFYWDGEKEPSVEVPVGDFFACGWGKFAQVSSLPVCVNPGSGFNCYWVMPFRKSCKVTMENLDEKNMTLYYQINYTLTEVPEDAGYLHAQFRRVNPLPYKSVYTIIDGVKGWGHYVGTYMCWGANNTGWWGEGEIKFSGPRTTSAAPTGLPWRGNTGNTPPPMPACLRSSSLTASGNPNSASVFTAGTSWTRCGSKRTSESPSRLWAGILGGGISLFRMISHLWLFGTRRNPTPGFPSSPKRISSRSSEFR